MTDASLGNLSSRGSVILTLTISALMLFSNPKELIALLGWRNLVTGIAMISVAVVVALTWNPLLDTPWYVLPISVTLLYVALLWGLFQRAVRRAAEEEATHYKDAWQRATASWQDCEQRVHMLKHPPPPPADPDQLVLDLQDKQPFVPHRLRRRLLRKRRALQPDP